MPTADGGGTLTSLKQAGIGALSLQTADTPYNLGSNSNQALGTIRASSLYLREDGCVGNLQQLDLVT